MAEPFRVVFVCSGNQVRSPLAAALFAKLTNDLAVEITSAGTLGIEGAPPPPEAQHVAAALGVDLTHHRSAGLTPAAVRNADLVVGFERAHLAAAVVEAGAPVERAFTLPELVRLLGSAGQVSETEPLARARALVAAAAAARRESRDFVPGEEIADPIGGPRRAYERVAREVAGLLEALTGMLFGVSRSLLSPKMQQDRWS